MNLKNSDSEVKKLYKYVSLSNCDFENIYNEQLFLRTATFFNDVFDSAPYYSEYIFNIILKAHIDEHGMNLPDSLNLKLQSFKEKLKTYRGYFRNL